MAPRNLVHGPTGVDPGEWSTEEEEGGQQVPEPGTPAGGHHGPEKPQPAPAPTRIVWRNVVLMVVLHLASLHALLFQLWTCRLYTLLWAVTLYLCSGLGITAGAHRLWSHRCYKAKLPLRLVLAMFNCAAFQNDIYEWSRDHRVHHKFSETDADPHNVNRGLFFAHVGWLLCRKHPAVVRKGAGVDLGDLTDDPVVRYQRKFYLPLVALFCFVVPWAVPTYLWGETGWNALAVPALLRYCLVLHATWLVNSLAHARGRRPYDTGFRAAENAGVAAAALGEGWHNYHHAFPGDYRTGEFGWRLNPTSLFIDLMAALGQVDGRKVASQKTIQARKRRTGELAGLE